LSSLPGGAKSNLTIGGAGIFDATLVSGLIALGMAELVGEIRERIGNEPGRGYPEELIEGLREPGRSIDEREPDEPRSK